MLREAAWTSSVNNLKTKILIWLLETYFYSLNDIFTKWSMQLCINNFIFLNMYIFIDIVV